MTTQVKGEAIGLPFFFFLTEIAGSHILLELAQVHVSCVPVNDSHARFKFLALPRPSRRSAFLC